MDFIPAILGLATGAIGGWLSAQFKFRNELKLIEARQSQTEDVDRQKRIEHYQSLLLLAASDLQDRLWHVTQRQATARSPILLKEEKNKPASRTWPMTPKHYEESSVYLVARYFAAVEMMRHEIRYLTYKQDRKTKDLRVRLTGVERAFAETDLQKEANARVTSDRPIFQLQQVFVGQSVWDRDDETISWMSYRDFVGQYENELVATAEFTAIRDLLVGTVARKNGSFHRRRLSLVLNALVDLLDFLDPVDGAGNGLFLEAGEREKVSLPDIPSGGD